MTYYEPSTHTKYRGYMDTDEQIFLNELNVPILSLYEGGTAETVWNHLQFESFREYLHV